MFKTLLINAVIDEIKRDILDEDTIALESLLESIDVNILSAYLSEEKLNQILGKE